MLRASAIATSTPGPPVEPNRRRGAQLQALLLSRPALAMAAAGAVAAALGTALGGMFAGAVMAVYGACGAAVWLRRLSSRAEATARRDVIDAVAALAGELRAGLAVGVALASATPALRSAAVVGKSAASVARKVGAAVQLAEASGAPLADVLDRLDSHLRAVDRARALAAAQAAGARASAMLLAAMPVAGLGLGFVVGTDPLGVLLHSPLGGACLIAAVVLQLAGVAWSTRLSRVEVPE